MLKLHLINPELTKRLKHRNYLVTRFLDTLNVDYEIVENDPDWIVIHPLFGNYLLDDKNLLLNLSQDNLDRFKQGKCNLLVWYPYETEHYGDPNVPRQIEGCLNAVDYKGDKVFLVTGNLNAELKSYPISKVEPVKSIPLLFFDWQLYDFLSERNETNQLQSTVTYKNNKSKAYMCLNGKDKHTRRYLLDRLPLEQGHVSYVCYDGVDPYIKSDTKVPIILDQEKHSIKRNDRWMNPEIYHDAYINVVTEAFPDKEIDCFITEKTFKPMLHLQPFMIQGNRYTLRRLREYGYQTFSDIWDESYDELETWQERTDAMLEQLHSFCTLSTHDQLAKCKQVMSKLRHNQEMVFNTASDVTRSAYLADILRAVSEGG